MEFDMESIQGVVSTVISSYRDDRGELSELYRVDELDHSVSLVYTSWTNPGVIRGPHEHLYQTDYFIFGFSGWFKLWLWDNRPESPTYKNKLVIMYDCDNFHSILVPPRVVHAYKCISQIPGCVVNMPDKLYKGAGKQQEVDEIRHEDVENSEFICD